MSGVYSLFSGVALPECFAEHCQDPADVKNPKQPYEDLVFAEKNSDRGQIFCIPDSILDPSLCAIAGLCVLSSRDRGDPPKLSRFGRQSPDSASLLSEPVEDCLIRWSNGLSVDLQFLAQGSRSVLDRSSSVWPEENNELR